MKGKTIKEKIENRFPNIHFSKIVVFKNPNEFTSMYIERINPNHIGILWGKRRKDSNKGTHYIKAGMVYFTMIPVVIGLSILGWFDVMTNWFYRGIINIGIFGLMLGFCVCFLFYGFILWLEQTDSYREYMREHNI